MPTHLPTAEQEAIFSAAQDSQTSNKAKTKVQQGQRTNSKIKMWQSLQQDVVHNSKGCWLIVNRYLDKDGYSQVMVKGETIKSHRLAFEMHYGYITNELVLHNCDQPNCINPLHLSLGSYKQNAEDMANRNRSSFGSRNGSSKLTEALALEIFDRTDKSVKELAIEYNLGEATIHQLKSGRTWSKITGLPKIDKKQREKKILPEKFEDLYKFLFGER